MSKFAPRSCGYAGSLIRHSSTGLCLALQVQQDGPTIAYAYRAEQCNINDDMQRFVWIQDPNFWQGLAGLASQTPIGPILATPVTAFNLSYFPMVVQGALNFTQYVDSSGQAPYFLSTQNSIPVRAAMTSVAEGPNGPVWADENNNVRVTLSSTVYVLDPATAFLMEMGIASILPPPFPTLTGKCLAFDGQLLQPGGKCGAPASVWATPCGLDGSFLRPPCNVEYVLSSVSRSVSIATSISWVPCSGTAANGGFSGQCLTCAEPWQFAKGALADTTEPLVTWTSAQGSALWASGKGHLRGYNRSVEDWWPGRGYTIPVAVTADGTCLDNKGAPTVGFTRCGTASPEVGTGIWFALPGVPTRPAASGCWTSAATLLGTCPMQYVPQDATSSLAFVCPKSACDVSSRTLPYLGVDKGATVRVYPSPGPWSSLWWFNNSLPEVRQALQNPSTNFSTLLNFRQNSDWYPLFSSFGRVLSYDVTFQFDGYLVPDYDGEYTLFVDTDAPGTEIYLVDQQTGHVLIPQQRMSLQHAVPGTSSATAFYWRGLQLFSGNPGSKRYKVAVSYPMRASTGFPDPSSGDAVFMDSSPYNRLLVLSWSRQGGGLGYAKQALDGYHLRHAPNAALVNVFDYQSQVQTTSQYYMSPFGRGWNAFIAEMPQWDTYVTAPLHDLADAVGPAVAPLYGGASPALRFLVLYAADLVSSLLDKASYAIMVIGVKDPNKYPPSAHCLSQLGSRPRAWMDALLDSLPRALEFFLDVEGGSASEGEQDVCDATEHRNHILGGSLKMFYFYSEMCNARYVDGRLVRCTLEDGLMGSAGSHCLGYNLPYGGFNTNALCSADGLSMLLVRRVLQNVRVLTEWAEALAVTLWSCLSTNAAACNLEGFAKETAQTVMTAFQNAVCTGNELVIRAVGTFVSFLNPAFSEMYASAGTQVVKQSSIFEYSSVLHAAHTDCANHVANNCPPQWCTLTHPPNGAPAQCVDSCLAASDASRCTGSCQWLNGRCFRNDEAWMLYQSYPLEASLITLATAGLAPLTFWPQYTFYGYAQVILDLLTGQDTAEAYGSWAGAADYAYANSTSGPTGGPPPVQSRSLSTRLQAAPRVFILRWFKSMVLPVRDGVFAFYEVVRSSVYVADPNALTDQIFTTFAGKLRNTVNLAELLISIFTEAFVDVIETMLRIVADFVMMLTDTSRFMVHVKHILLDIENLFKDVFDMFEQAIFQLIMSLPGFHQLCPIFDGADGIPGLSQIVNTVITDTCSVIDQINTIINSFESEINSVINVVGANANAFTGGGGTSSSSTSGIFASLIDPLHAANDLIKGIGLPQLPSILSGLSIPRPSFCAFQMPTNICNPNWMDENPLMEFEPDTCGQDSDCGRGKSCMVDGADTTCRWTKWGGASAIQNDSRTEWVQPCPCDDFAPGSPAPFCNFATGFCQEGPSFFGPPLASCPASSLQLLPENQAFREALCWVLPAWRCGNRATSLHAKNIPGWNGTVATPSDYGRCLWHVAGGTSSFGQSLLEGPYLCSSQCSPSALNGDNRLMTVTYADGSTACACAVGLAVGSNHHVGAVPGNYSALALNRWSVNAAILAPTPVSAAAALGLQQHRIVGRAGRRLLEETETRPPTPCSRAFECGAPGARCQSPWGVAVDCEACPLAAAPLCGEDQCTCALPSAQAALDEAALDASRWTGNTTCDALVRAYAKEPPRPLEVEVLRACVFARHLGDAVALLSGVQSLPRNIFYSPSSAAQLVFTTLIALPGAMAAQNRTDGVARASARVGANAELVGALVHGLQRVSRAVVAIKSSPAFNAASAVGEATLRTVRREAQRVSQTARSLSQVDDDYGPAAYSRTVDTSSSGLGRGGTSPRKAPPVPHGATLTPPFPPAPPRPPPLVDIPTDILPSDVPPLGQNFVCPALAPLWDSLRFSLSTTSSYYLYTVPTVSLPKYLGHWQGVATPPAPAAPPLTSPPPSPPPHAPPGPLAPGAPDAPSAPDAPPGPPASNHTSTSLQDLILDAADSVVPPLHLRHHMEEAVAFFTHTVHDGHTELEHLIAMNSACPLSSVLCQGRTDGGPALVRSAWWAGTRIVVAGAAVSLVSGPLGTTLSAALTGALWVAFPFVVMSHSYHMSAGCFLRLPPLLPVCLADDLFDLVNGTLLPPNLPVPTGIWEGPDRTGAPVVCSSGDIGMKDGLRVAAYLLESRLPGWQSQAPLFTLATVFGTGHVDSYAFFYTDKDLSQPAFEACFIITAPSVLIASMVLVPILLLALYAVQVALVLYLKSLRIVSNLADSVRKKQD